MRPVPGPRQAAGLIYVRDVDGELQLLLDRDCTSSGSVARAISDTLRNG